MADVEPDVGPSNHVNTGESWKEHGWALSARDVVLILIVVLFVSAIINAFR
jgi:hypothetical protein